MGSAEALAAATSVAADAFGVADRGRIAEGHLADLVLVRGDLEEDLSRSHDIVAIWKDGYLVERAGGSAGVGPQAEAAPAPAETLVADFEDGLEARFGAWDVTTDQMSGGSSNARMTVQDGALVVTGEIAPGLAFPWAGVIWMPGEQFMQPVDFSGREVIRFRTGGWGAVLGDAAIRPDPAGPPPTVTFVAPEEWTQVEIRLEDFPTATPEIIGGLAHPVNDVDWNCPAMTDTVAMWSTNAACHHGRRSRQPSSRPPDPYSTPNTYATPGMWTSRSKSTAASAFPCRAADAANACGTCFAARRKPNP